MPQDDLISKLEQMFYFEVSYFSSGVKFQKSFLANLNSVKIGR